jgi:AraC-like DNA-binding protein
MLTLAMAMDLASGRVEPIVSDLTCSVLGVTQRRFEPHWLPPSPHLAHYTLLMCTEGGAAFSVDGEPAPVTPGSVLLLRPGVKIERRPPASAFGAYEVDFIAKLNGWRDVAEACDLPVALRMETFRWLKLLESVRIMLTLLTKRHPGYELAVHSHCLRLLDLIWKEALQKRGQYRMPPGTRAWRNAKDWLTPVLKVIENRCAERITLGELAKVANLHPAYFSSRFRQVTGVSPLTFVMQRRLQRARDLLRTTDQPVRSIAATTGFYDAAHLIRAFRSAEGISPGRYRKVKGRALAR